MPQLEHPCDLRMPGGHQSTLFQGAEWIWFLWYLALWLGPITFPRPWLVSLSQLPGIGQGMGSCLSLWQPVLCTSSLQFSVILEIYEGGRGRKGVLRQFGFKFPVKWKDMLVLQKVVLYLVAIWFWTNCMNSLGLFSSLQNEDAGLSKLAVVFRVNEI